MPRAGEPLEVLDIDSLAGVSPRVRTAVKQLAQEQAPQTVAQLVLWHLGTGLDWSRLEPLARGWANPGEFALARRFVNRLDDSSVVTEHEAPSSSTGSLDIDLSASCSESEPLAAQLHTLLDGRTMFGLMVRLRQAGPPQGPSIACQVRLERAVASVRVLTTVESGTAWRHRSTFSLALADTKGSVRPAVEVADALALGVLDRLVRVELSPGPRIKGKATYEIRLDNASPLVLKGLAVAGSATGTAVRPSHLLGISLPPQKHLSVPVSAKAVERLRLKEGIQILGADLAKL
jgi:hypothetical protein